MVCCFRLWSIQDQAADEDEVIQRGSITPHLAKEELKNLGGTSTTNNTPQPKSGHDGSTWSTTTTLEIAEEVEEEEEEESEKAAEVPEVTETELEDAPHAEEQPPQETETPEGVPDAGSDKDESKDDDADKNATPTEAAAPASDGDGVLAAPAPTAEDEAVKRVDGDLTDGGLLLTQVMRGNRKVVRRLELEKKKGVLKWEVDALFGMKWEKVKLPEARVMSTGSLVKIGVVGKSEFFSFEACDDLEAGAVCKTLVAHAMKHKEPGSDDGGASEADKEAQKVEDGAKKEETLPRKGSAGETAATAAETLAS
ncbi:hypothetical protein Esi_0254_0029 [Ectocarpus siliculosus]|uniref:Uncharacterized protein n=1 Tax=Ectocarpus siliculosus TaxID=2880 RepID=D8LJG1_ECTSI|nr:hypothetical protein Esi_0254_0029 [Ectocarpus siliculosus]|eukprot:CBN79494.1 hypothetical protein Esi_0254_0029 [Ectocarpus siliculosus]